MIKRYWRARGGMIKEDNGEYMLSSEVLPEIDRLNARIADLEAEKQKITGLADKVTLENLALYGQIRTLKERIAELEAALKRQESELRECETFWKAQKTIKENGNLHKRADQLDKSINAVQENVLGDLKAAHERIAELEAALKRQDSELRECEAFWKAQKTTLTTSQKMFMHKDCAYMSLEGIVCNKCGRVHDIEYSGWRDLPPMPEKE